MQWELPAKQHSARSSTLAMPQGAVDDAHRDRPPASPTHRNRAIFPSQSTAVAAASLRKQPGARCPDDRARSRYRAPERRQHRLPLTRPQRRSAPTSAAQSAPAPRRRTPIYMSSGSSPLFPTLGGHEQATRSATPVPSESHPTANLRTRSVGLPLNRQKSGRTKDNGQLHSLPARSPGCVFKCQGCTRPGPLRPNWSVQWLTTALHCGCAPAPGHSALAKRGTRLRIRSSFQDSPLHRLAISQHGDGRRSNASPLLCR